MKSRSTQIWQAARAEGFWWLCAAEIVAILALGGGTHAGFLSDVMLQFACLPLLAAALWRAHALPVTAQVREGWLLCAAVVLLPMLQLLPLPPSLWARLPGHQPAVAVLGLIAAPAQWRPLSMTPEDTWLTAIGLLPPLAIFLATLLMPLQHRRRMALIVLGFGVVCVFVGLLQVAQGQSSHLRFFDYSNPTEAVGFFANRNHFAALLYTLTLFAAAWTIAAGLAPESDPRNRRNPATQVLPRPIALLGGFTLMVVLVAAQAMARSRAGLALTMLALLGAFVLAISGAARPSGRTSWRLLAGAITLAIMFAAQFALYRVLERFSTDPLADARLPFARNTISAALAYMPFGSGLGSFVSVYGGFEKGEDALVNTFANHAHNDLLELWLETGVAGLMLLAAFGFWFALRSYALWTRPLRPGTLPIDQLLARAGTLVIGLLLAHSLVDYPLRTTAMAAMFAFCAGLLIDPPAAIENLARTAQPRTATAPRRRSRTSGVPPAPAPQPGLPPWPQPVQAATPVPPAAPVGEAWGEDVAWPAEWRKTADPPPASPEPAPAPMLPKAWEKKPG